MACHWTHFNGWLRIAFNSIDSFDEESITKVLRFIGQETPVDSPK